MKEFIEKVILKGRGCSTIDVMNWADEHPEARFSFTRFESELCGWRHWLIVSEDEPLNVELEWHTLYNGWQRTTFGVGWICRKNGRYIIITD